MTLTDLPRRHNGPRWSRRHVSSGYPLARRDSLRRSEQKNIRPPSCPSWPSWF